MQVGRVSGYDCTSFGRLNAAKKGARYVVNQLSTRINPTEANKMYAVYHGVAPKVEKTVNLPPVIQAMKRYLAADI